MKLIKWITLAVIQLFSAPSLLAGSSIQFDEYNTMKDSAGLSLTDSMTKAVNKLAKGASCAVPILEEFLERSAEIDAYAFGPMKMLTFDFRGILGDKICKLYFQVCNEDIVCVHAVTRSLQLGIEPEQKIYYAIENYGEGIDIEELLAKVREKLPSFASNIKDEL